MDERLRRTEYVLLSSAADAEYWAWDLRLRDGGARVAVMPDPHEAFGYMCSRRRIAPRSRLRLVVDGTDWHGYGDLAAAMARYLPDGSIWQRDGDDILLLEGQADPPEIEVTASMPTNPPAATSEPCPAEDPQDREDADEADEDSVAVTGAELDMLLGGPDLDGGSSHSPDRPGRTDGGSEGIGLGETSLIEDEPEGSEGRNDDGGASS